MRERTGHTYIHTHTYTDDVRRASYFMHVCIHTCVHDFLKLLFLLFMHVRVKVQTLTRLRKSLACAYVTFGHSQTCILTHTHTRTDTTMAVDKTVSLDGDKKHNSAPKEQGCRGQLPITYNVRCTG